MADAIKFTYELENGVITLAIPERCNYIITFKSTKGAKLESEANNVIELGTQLAIMFAKVNHEKKPAKMASYVDSFFFHGGLPLLKSVMLPPIGINNIERELLRYRSWQNVKTAKIATIFQHKGLQAPLVFKGNEDKWVQTHVASLRLGHLTLLHKGNCKTSTPKQFQDKFSKDQGGYKKHRSCFFDYYDVVYNHSPNNRKTKTQVDYEGDLHGLKAIATER